MNWKIFLIVFINIFAIFFPYNIVGCGGGDADPYDYFVSFFHKDLSDQKGYEPFYYTNYQFLYDSNEPVNAAEATSAEWVGYSGNKFSNKEAYSFVCEYSQKDISTLYYHIEKNQPLNIPDSMKKNEMTRFFITSKDLEALGYLLYAKNVEPNVTGTWTSWEPIERDTVKMVKLIKNGQQLYTAAKKDFIKLRYAYQVTRLAHYSKHYDECIRLYNDLIKNSPVNSVLKDLSLSLYAGALMRNGEKNRAAYEFSKLFSKSGLKRVSNYMSFDWCVSRFDEESRMECMALAKSGSEKANIIGLFVLGSSKNELKSLEEIYRLAPSSSILDVLTIREMHKLEENYFTPSIQFEKGQQAFYIGYKEVTTSDPTYTEFENETKLFVEFCVRVASGPRTDKAFFLLASAHAAMIARDNTKARTLLNECKKKKLSPKLQDQLAMTNLLLTINSQDIIDSNFEVQLMPSIQWLEKKAAIDNEYAKFLRRLFSDVLYAKYKKSTGSNVVKYLLCSGVADKINERFVKEGWGYYMNSLYLLRREAEPAEIEQLIAMLESKKLNTFEKYLVNQSAFNKDDVNDIAGTAWLRQFNFAAAEKWFKKIPAVYYQKESFAYYLAANPFADLLLDTHAPTKQDTVKYTKLSFTQKMMRLQKQLATITDQEQKAKTCYEMAKGFYQMSYWGNSWMLVQYDWSTYIGEKDKAKSGSNEYYNAEKAEEYYQKASELSRDRNFKAKALYMAAKCDQKEFGKLPFVYEYETPELYHIAVREWLIGFNKRNGYFTKLVNEYNTTAFYKEAYNTCSYLKDFSQTKK